MSRAFEALAIDALLFQRPKPLVETVAADEFGVGARCEYQPVIAALLERSEVSMLPALGFKVAFPIKRGAQPLVWPPQKQRPFLSPEEVDFSPFYKLFGGVLPPEAGRESLAQF